MASPHTHSVDRPIPGPWAIRQYAASGPGIVEQSASRGRAGRVALLGRRVLPGPLIPPVRLALTYAQAPLAPLRVRRALRRGPVRLNLGSGKFPIEGWTNIDLAGVPVEIAHDLRRGIPFPDESVDAVVNEHLLEHIPLGGAVALLEECWRVLRPGGILRVSVPDAGAYLRSYARDGAFIDRNRPGRPTRMLALQEVFYGHGHTTMYDAETLEAVMRAAGFDQLEPREYGQSRLSPCPDAAHRRSESLYLEAVKSDARARSAAVLHPGRGS